MNGQLCSVTTMNMIMIPCHMNRLHPIYYDAASIGYLALIWI
jgi:hypothetical protein